MKHRLIPLLAALLCTAASTLVAQTASTPDAATLAKYDKNHNGKLDPDELDRAGINLVNDEVGVRWVYSFLSADHKKTYCLYEAPNPGAIREAAARLGIPADVIVEVEVEKLNPQLT